MDSGMQNQGHQQFQPPPNMPNINFNAPVIRLGVGQDQLKPSTPTDRLTHGQGGGRGGLEGRGSNAEPLGRRDRMGLGAGGDNRNLDRERAAVRESMMALQPPTREEVARTIFIGGLGEGVLEDYAIENLLRCAGKLRRWTRAKDADDRLCKFGFAEYEDVESLEAANEILVDVDVPVLNKAGALVKNDEGEVKKTTLLVVVDEQSKSYIEEWKGRRREDDDARQFRIDGCKEDLRQSLAGIMNAGAFMANGGQNGDADGDTMMGDANGEQNGNSAAEVVMIPLTLEDELSDIPTEMRATVAEEIKAFRDRSNRRDLERLRREEELEHAERMRSIAGTRVNRLASPPPSAAPSGPASASNGIPVGPRDRNSGVHGAPSGPKGYRGAQMPGDYVNGIAFVGANGATNGISLHREDEDAEESDNELERRRQAAKMADLEKQYLDAERKWLNRERTRGAAQEREKVREDIVRREREREKDAIAARLREWDDDAEARLGREEYYYDRSSWLRQRAAYRDHEQREDDRDRAQEAREKADERRKANEARGLADSFLDRMGDEVDQKASLASAGEQPSGFKMSLGSAAARTKAAQTAATQAAAPTRKAVADAEGLLEDEEDAAASGLKRPELKPLTDTSTGPLGADMTDAERAQAKQALASEIPTSTADLFAYPVKFQFLTPDIIEANIRPFVEKKVVESLGVQEDLLVDMVVQGLRGARGARGIVEALEEALEDEAEVLVRKVWRLVVFWTEVEGRGLV